MVASKACGCPHCTEKLRPGTKPTSREHAGSWQYRYTGPGGKAESVNAASYDEAVAEGEKRKVAIREGTYIDSSAQQMRLSSWWELWKPNLTGDAGFQAHQHGFYLKHIEPKFGTWRLSAISYREVQTWVNGLTSKAGLEPSSVQKVFGVLDRLMESAKRDRRIPYNPCDGVVLPAVKPRHPEEMRPPTYAQLWLIRQQLPAHYHAMQIVAQETGLRWGELTGLRACWVDLDNQQLHVREVLKQVRGKLVRKPYPKSSAGMRTVPLTGLAVRVLREHLEQRQPSTARTDPSAGMCTEELVFVSRNKTRGGKPHILPMRQQIFNRTWNRALLASGVGRVKTKQWPDGSVRREYWPTFHDQRHAFASKLHARGVPEALVQEVLGHRRAGKVTWLYTHASADYAAQVLAALKAGQPGRPRLRVVA